MSVTTQDELDFDDLAIREVKVKVDRQSYFLREAMGAGILAYQKARMSGSKLTDDGKLTLDHSGIIDSMPLLVSVCLYTVKDEPVSLEQILKWPARVQDALFKKAKELSEIDQPDSEEQIKSSIEKLQAKLTEIQAKGDPLKNEQSGTTGG